MKLIYAKLWLKKYIKYNYDESDEKTFNRKLNWKIVNLSHRVYNSHGLKGHNTRQQIRKILWDYSEKELKQYGLSRYHPSMISRIISYLKRIITGKN
jgi:hypothetical protein